MLKALKKLYYNTITRSSSKRLQRTSTSTVGRESTEPRARSRLCDELDNVTKYEETVSTELSDVGSRVKSTATDKPRRVRVSTTAVDIKEPRGVIWWRGRFLNINAVSRRAADGRRGASSKTAFRNSYQGKAYDNLKSPSPIVAPDLNAPRDRG
ncbi:hypothetical protein EVAR_56754_1 [Eumeta japonica]|uniref:Uncharacterized protein n=1 Tax=Eumeta variegata TaxID=151549 RepID=A0A4C1XP05_EUMVA|nr:hypothetical protein EVAR_56754_1 [Eumeta japonica]